MTPDPAVYLRGGPSYCLFGTPAMIAAARTVVLEPAATSDDAPDVPQPRTVTHANTTVDKPRRSSSIVPRVHQLPDDSSDCDGNPWPSEGALFVDLTATD